MVWRRGWSAQRCCMDMTPSLARCEITRPVSASTYPQEHRLTYVSAAVD